MNRKHEKLILTIITVLIWCICYFGINILSKYRKTHILALSFEKNIPLVPFFVIFYMSTYIFVFLAILVIKDIIYFRKATIAYLLIIFISSILYLAYPVKMIRPELTNTDTIPLKILSFEYAIDQPYNLFPSLHVALSFLTLLIIFHYNRIMAYSFIPLVILIMLSTLFVKQHYLADIIASIVLSFFVYYIVIMKDIFNKFVYS